MQPTIKCQPSLQQNFRCQVHTVSKCQHFLLWWKKTMKCQNAKLIKKTALIYSKYPWSQIEYSLESYKLKTFVSDLALPVYSHIYLEYVIYSVGCFVQSDTIMYKITHSKYYCIRSFYKKLYNKWPPTKFDSIMILTTQLAYYLQ